MTGVSGTPRTARVTADTAFENTGETELQPETSMPAPAANTLLREGQALNSQLSLYRRLMVAGMAAISRQTLRLLAGTVICVSALLTTPAAAQDLGDILEQLQEGLNRAAPELFDQGTAVLDRIRERGADLVSPFEQSALPEERALFTGLTQEELVVVRRFCQGRLSSAEEDLLTFLPEFSALEQDYCRRAGEPLLQFGYQMFDGARSPQVLVNGAISEDYRLGIGDEIIVTFVGQQSGTESHVVDREGRVIIDPMPPLAAAGRTFGEFRSELEARVAQAFLGTDVFVSLGAVRLVGVSVTGEVRRPGVHRLTGLSTVYDAIAAAGSIRKTGSLRNVVLYRQGVAIPIDAYELLRGGTAETTSLAEGDRIAVPALGTTVAVAGRVLRPGIYELAGGRESATVEEILALAGGTLRPSGTRISQWTFDAAGRLVVNESVSPASSVSGGDLIQASFGEDFAVGTVSLDGHVREAGRRSRELAPSVASLIGSADRLRQGAYLPLAVLETTDPGSGSRRFFGISLGRILSGEQDFALRDDDRLIVFGQEDIRFLSSGLVQVAMRDASIGRRDEFAAQTVASAADELTQSVEQLISQVFTAALAQCRSLEFLGYVVRTTRSGRFSSAVLPGNETLRAASGAQQSVHDVPAAGVPASPCPEIFDATPSLLPFVLEHAASIQGEVRVPGIYPVAEGTQVATVVGFAGGVTREADLTRVEVTRFRSDQASGTSETVRGLADLSGTEAGALVVNPGDGIRFNAVFSERDSGPVLLTGEFVRPGYYDIRRGETMSELVARAGGLTAQAYPYGAIFTRESARNAEREGFIRAARDLNAAAVAALAREDVPAAAVNAIRLITVDIANAEPLGRVVIEADPTVLQVRPDLDTVMQPGDTLFIPKRPNSVTVSGDVLNPGAVQFVPGARADVYIAQAGGYQRSADRNRVFLVYPNGAAQPLQLLLWSYNPVQIPPGSTIVTPKDPAPFAILNLTREVTQVISQIALTAASIAVIGD